VYPDGLIPEGSDEKKGKCTITIEFEENNAPAAEPAPEKVETGSRRSQKSARKLTK
jgi:hypothetical protein